jgi:hypothetical protein
MTLKRFSAPAGNVLHQAVLLGMVALLAWAAYSFSASFRSCPHEADSFAAPFGKAPASGNAAAQRASLLQETVPSAPCCETLHDGALAQPSLPAILPPGRFFVAAPPPRPSPAHAVPAPASERAARAILRADARLYLRTQRLLI